ncbi:MAG: Sec-independent protein translocase protein TatB [Alphaproteobacteria bacterium]|nr:Sec-independent protein translocase protein TatB [Alphaproteobacteria bacterium]
MLDIGFSELLLIAVAALVILGPKDLPVVLRHVVKFLREMRSLYAGLKHQMTQVMEEVGLNDAARGIGTIIDLEGKPRQAYDVTALDALAAKPTHDDAHTS